MMNKHGMNKNLKNVFTLKNRTDTRNILEMHVNMASRKVLALDWEWVPSKQSFTATMLWHFGKYFNYFEYLVSKYSN